MGSDWLSISLIVIKLFSPVNVHYSVTLQYILYCQGNVYQSLVLAHGQGKGLFFWETPTEILDSQGLGRLVIHHSILSSSAGSSSGSSMCHYWPLTLCLVLCQVHWYPLSHFLLEWLHELFIIPILLMRKQRLGVKLMAI